MLRDGMSTMKLKYMGFPLMVGKERILEELLSFGEG